jgi:hypothetical protein
VRFSVTALPRGKHLQVLEYATPRLFKSILLNALIEPRLSELARQDGCFLESPPTRNLVSYGSVNNDETHAKGFADPSITDLALGELTHPQFMLRVVVADNYSFDPHCGGAVMHRSCQLIPGVKASLRHC